MQNKYSKSKSLGKMLGFFFSIIGLFAGFLYPEGSEEREDFIDGWFSGFMSMLLLVICGGILLALVLSVL